MLLLMTVTEQIAGLDASIEIAAPVADVWRTVSDVRRTGEWSPECRRVVPLGRVRNGTWLIGFNRRGARDGRRSHASSGSSRTQRSPGGS
jgi:hypothetical protein